jgi:hypothetical protein
LIQIKGSLWSYKTSLQPSEEGETNWKLAVKTDCKKIILKTWT